MLEQDVADPVGDGKVDSAEPDEIGGQGSHGVGGGEAGDPVDGGAERDAVLVVGGLDAEPNRNPVVATTRGEIEATHYGGHE